MNATTTTMTKMPTMNRGAVGEVEAFVMANCRSMLHNAVVSTIEGASSSGEEVGIMYDCKICGRKFKSFQALGGHRASHKNSKLLNSGKTSDDVKVPAKFKTHKCKICDAVFSSGQALGGHMRRHKDELLLETSSDNNNQDDDAKKVTSAAALSGVTAESSDSDDDVSEKKRKIVDDDEEEEVPLTRSSSCKRVCLDLDLDLSLWWKEELLEEYLNNNAVQEDEHNVRKVEEEEGDSTAERRSADEKEEEEDLLKLELSL